MKRILQAIDNASTNPVEGANDMKKFLQVVTEGANPHKVSLPVQMAMQHYQQKEPAPVVERKPSLLNKFFQEVNQEHIEEQAHKRQLMNQYASVIAERVLMKEGREVISEKSTSEKQARTMAAAAHDPKFAKKLGIKQSVAKEFNKADTGTKQLSNAMKHKKVKEHEIPGHTIGFTPGPGGPGLMSNEAHDPKFLNFMNKSMSNRQDAKPQSYDPNTTMTFDNMPGYKHAFKFGMDILKKMDPDTKEHFANASDNTLLSYMIDIAEKKGFIPKYFVEEDLDEVTQWFDEKFHDPEMEGWSWADLLRDMIGQEPNPANRAAAQSHKQMMAATQANKHSQEKIDPTKLKVVDRTDTGKSEIWYPHGEFFGTPTWAVVQGGFKDKAHAEHTLHQLKANPNVVNIIKKAIANDLDEGQSAQVKLSRAWDREKAKSTASLERAKQAKAEFEKEWKAKQEKKSQEPNPIKEANAKKRTLKNSNPCWKGYHPVGTKKKGGRTVPNCVPKE